HGLIYSQAIEDFDITEVKTSSDAVQIEILPLGPQELAEFEAKAGFRLEGSVNSGTGPGDLRELATVHASLENHPKFELPVTGHRSGPVLLVGAGWTAADQLLELGTVSSERGKTARLTVMIPPGEEEMKLTDVKSDLGFVDVTLKPEQVGGDLPR